MTHKPEYRVIFYFDNRYQMERYIIVSGTWEDAVAMVSSLKTSGFATNVSNYYAVDSFYITDRSEGSHLPIAFKPERREMSKREFWKGK